MNPICGDVESETLPLLILGYLELYDLKQGHRRWCEVPPIGQTMIYDSFCSSAIDTLCYSDLIGIFKMLLFHRCFPPIPRNPIRTLPSGTKSTEIKSCREVLHRLSRNHNAYALRSRKSRHYSCYT